jgi:hypothetical protein
LDWSGVSTSGGSLENGIYLFRISLPHATYTIKGMLVR